jgi:hypothetical protein
VGNSVNFESGPDDGGQAARTRPGSIERPARIPNIRLSATTVVHY